MSSFYSHTVSQPEVGPGIFVLAGTVRWDLTRAGPGIGVPACTSSHAAHCLPREGGILALAPVIVGGSGGAHSHPHNPEACDWQGGGLRRGRMGGGCGEGRAEGNAGDTFLSNH